MVYTRESILQVLQIYATRCHYVKENGEERTYLLTGHPLGQRDKFHVPEEKDRVTVWDAKKHKWRYLRPEGVQGLSTSL